MIRSKSYIKHLIASSYLSLLPTHIENGFLFVTDLNSHYLGKLFTWWRVTYQIIYFYFKTLIGQRGCNISNSCHSPCLKLLCLGIEQFRIEGKNTCILSWVGGVTLYWGKNNNGLIIIVLSSPWYISAYQVSGWSEWCRNPAALLHEIHDVFYFIYILTFMAQKIIHQSANPFKCGI